MPRTDLFSRGAPIAVVLCLSASGGFASEPVMSIAALQETYLDCERRASVAMLGAGDAMLCSMVYQDLKDRAFGGDWTRLHDWARPILAADLSS